MKNTFDEIRITEAAEHVRKNIEGMLMQRDLQASRDLFGSVYDNGLTNQEAEVAIIRALGLAVLEVTERMFQLVDVEV